MGRTQTQALAVSDRHHTKETVKGIVCLLYVPVCVCFLHEMNLGAWLFALAMQEFYGCRRHLKTSPWKLNLVARLVWPSVSIYLTCFVLSVLTWNFLIRLILASLSRFYMGGWEDKRGPWASHPSTPPPILGQIPQCPTSLIVLSEWNQC